MKAAQDRISNCLEAESRVSIHPISTICSTSYAVNMPKQEASASREPGQRPVGLTRRECRSLAFWHVGGGWALLSCPARILIQVSPPSTLDMKKRPPVRAHTRLDVAFANSAFDFFLHAASDRRPKFMVSVRVFGLRRLGTKGIRHPREIYSRSCVQLCDDAHLCYGFGYGFASYDTRGDHMPLCHALACKRSGLSSSSTTRLSSTLVLCPRLEVDVQGPCTVELQARQAPSTFRSMYRYLTVLLTG